MKINDYSPSFFPINQKMVTKLIPFFSLKVPLKVATIGIAYNNLMSMSDLHKTKSVLQPFTGYSNLLVIVVY